MGQKFRLSKKIKMVQKEGDGLGFWLRYEWGQN
jgi:hypothetical protein